MIKRLALLWALMGTCAAFGWIANSPSQALGFGPTATGRVLADLGPVSALVDAEWRSDPGVVYTGLTAGAYVQPWDFLRLGAFYKRQTGVRHDEDWQFSSATGSWGWQDVNSRVENLLVLDATPRWLMTFLPGESWRGELKARYFYNFFNGNQTLTLRPGLAYFWLADGAPVFSFFLQYEAYIPLNYGSGLVYEHWIYLSAMRPIQPWLQLGVQASLHIQDWSSTPYFVANTVPSSTFFVSQPIFNVGLVAVIHLGLFQ